jgi:nicotinamide-nucleotide amidase
MPELPTEGLMAAAARVAERLKARGETLAVSESSGGGLIAAALVAQGGASAYFLGGAVVYTAQAREALLGITPADMTGMRSASEPYARLAAERLRARIGADWALAETGASGPTGNRYGDAAGHCCLAVAGARPRAATLETGSSDRAANMRAFALEALALLEGALADA